jgi:hypothetical protein
MNRDARPAGSLAPAVRDSAGEPLGAGQRRTQGALKRQWLVQCDGLEEHVEADEVEITASGVLLFHRSASRMEQERTLLSAFSPELWRRCQLVSER